MDEAMEVITEGTTPTEETNVESQSDPVEEPTAAPQAAEQPTKEGSTTDTEQPAAAEMFTLQYNHEDMSVPKDEAIRLAQYGYFVEKIGKEHSVDVRDAIAKLDYLATLQGKTVGDLVTDLVNGVDQSYRNELIEQLGEGNPLVEEMLELRKTKSQKAYEDAKAERTTREQQAAEEAKKSTTARLAEQFEAMRETFPEFDTVEKVPETVIKRAMVSGDLEKEMLRYERSERMKVEAAKASQEQNKKQNVGSVASEKSDENDPLILAMMRGLRG